MFFVFISCVQVIVLGTVWERKDDEIEAFDMYTEFNSTIYLSNVIHNQCSNKLHCCGIYEGDNIKTD